MEVLLHHAVILTTDCAARGEVEGVIEACLRIFSPIVYCTAMTMVERSWEDRSGTLPTAESHRTSRLTLHSSHNHTITIAQSDILLLLFRTGMLNVNPAGPCRAAVEASFPPHPPFRSSTHRGVKDPALS